MNRTFRIEKSLANKLREGNITQTFRAAISRGLDNTKHLVKGFQLSLESERKEYSTVCVRIDDSHYERLTALRDRTRVSIDQLAELALIAYLDEKPVKGTYLQAKKPPPPFTLEELKLKAMGKLVKKEDTEPL